MTTDPVQHAGRGEGPHGMMSAAAIPQAEPFPPRSTAYLALFILMAACFFSLLDRQILSLLVQPMKHDLGLSDTQIGTLQGIGFALSYSLMALPCGWMADRFNRFRLIAAGMVVWCLATFSLGFAGSFTELLAARVLVGAGEAALMPAAYSLLADLFPAHQRGRAFATFMSAIILGIGGSLIVGGVILRALEGVPAVILPMLGPVVIWKAAFIIVSLPGLFVALLFLFLKEPARRTHPQDSHAGRGLTHYVRTHPHAFFTVLAIYSIVGFVGYAVNSWTPTLLIRNYGVETSSAGFVTGGVMLFSGLIGAFISGIVGDRWTVARRRGGRLPLNYFLWIGGLPGLLLLTLGGSVPVAALGFLFYGVVAGIGFVSSSAVLQEMVPGHLRGRATALWYLVTGIIANGFGPVATGVLNDYVFRDESALPYSILAIAVPSLLLGLIITITGIAAYDRACLRHE